MDRQKKRLLIIVLLAVLIVAGSFYASWQENGRPNTAFAPARGMAAETPVAHPVGYSGEKAGQKVSINNANKDQLESLPGIGPALAGRIIDYRRTNGRFGDINDLKRVPGIGEVKYKKIKEKITL